MILFLIQTVIISLTGVMAPGPMTAAAVGTGTRSQHAGVLIAVGHGIVEFPLMVCVYYGLGHILSIAYVKAAIFTFGGIFLLLMGIDMLMSIRRTANISNGQTKTPLAVGVFFSLGNVFFLLWWITVGAALIAKAVEFGIIGVIAFATVHWLCDLAWLSFLSKAAYKGGRVFGDIFQKVVFGMCGVFLLLFSGAFLLDAVRLWFR